MSLVSDPDFLIHSLRLSYLRNIEDLYGPRIISLSSSAHANPFIATAGLADIERWPELGAPPSPTISDDERPGPNGFPGATSLRHTQTIMGPNRTGALGMRVNAKRESGSYRARSMRTQTPVPPIEPPTVIVDGASAPATSPQATATVAAAAPAPPKQVLFVPKFKGAAEMEVRRRQRMAARARNFSPNQPAAPAQPAQNLSWDSSSEDEPSPLPVPPEEDSSSDSDFGEVIADGMSDMDSEGDDFDPEFAAARTGAWESGVSLLSSETDLSTSYALVSPPAGEGKARRRLSPVDESHHGAPEPPDSYFEMVTPSRPTESESPLQQRSQVVPAGPAISPQPAVIQPTSNSPNIIFTRRPVPPMLPQSSALSAMLAAQTGGPPNPFTELYGAIAGRGVSAPLTVRVYFPHARAPEGEPMDLSVRADSTVEEVLGFALWSYWEEGWLPKIGEVPREEEDGEDHRLSAVGWIMRIAEEDGEVDEDFPPPDRASKISKFNFDAYAILEASTYQVQQNQVLENKIQRRPSRIMAAKKKPAEASTPAMLVPPSMGVTVPVGILAGGSTFAPASAGLLSTSLGPSSAHGPQLFLRIRVADVVDAVHVSTTLPVSAGMYMAEVLEALCKKRRLGDPADYALVLDDILIPLDRTVASLQGKMNLVLVKRSMLPELGIDTGNRIGRTTDPNASIFKRMSEVPDNPAADYTAAYKKYNVLRKMPVLGRHERILAIDGVYIHMMPSSGRARAVFENARTVSYHIKSVAGVNQLGKSSAFKLIVHREGGAKRYEFEAETSKQAAEIVGRIKGMKSDLERKGTLNKSRRSRQVGM